MRGWRWAGTPRPWPNWRRWWRRGGWGATLGQLIVASYRAAARPMRCAPTSGAAPCSPRNWAWSPGPSCGGWKPPCSPRTPARTGSPPAAAGRAGRARPAAAVPAEPARRLRPPNPREGRSPPPPWSAATQNWPIFATGSRSRVRPRRRGGPGRRARRGEDHPRRGGGAHGRRRWIHLRLGPVPGRRVDPRVLAVEPGAARAAGRAAVQAARQRLDGDVEAKARTAPASSGPTRPWPPRSARRRGCSRARGRR